MAYPPAFLKARPFQKVQPIFLNMLASLTGLVAASFLLEFIILALLRAGYPYELEWIEGASVDEIRYILQAGLPYVEPDIHFLPLPYTPVYFLLSAALTKMIGTGFLAPRFISIIASLGCFYHLFSIVSRVTRRNLPGLLAAGIFAASFRFSGAWMDLAKTDSLFLFFVLAAFSMGSRPGRWPAVASSFLYLLAYFTKQLALPVILAVAGLSLIQSGRRTLPRWLITAFIGLVAFFTLDFASQGWFSFYTLKSVALHHLVTDRFYFLRAILWKMWPAILVGFCYPWLSLRTPLKPGVRNDVVRNLGFVIAIFLASWGYFFKTWTYLNGFMPAVAGIALLAGLGLGQILHSENIFPASQTIRSRLLKASALVLLLLQFGLLFYPPLEQLPEARQREAAERFVQKLRSLPGDVWVFSHGYISAQAGKPTFLHSAGIGDITGGRLPVPGTDVFARREKVVQMIQQAVTGQRFRWVILDKDITAWQPYYVPIEQLEENATLSQVTGVSSRPMHLLVMNPIARGGIFPVDDPVFEPFFIAGWGAYEHGARQAISPVARLRVLLEAGHSYQVLLRAVPSCSNRQPSPKMLSLLWNGEFIGEVRFTSCMETGGSFSLPTQSIQEAENELGFQAGKQFNSNMQIQSRPGNETFSLVSLKFLQK